MKHVLRILVCYLAFGVVLAEAPSLVNFQGKLTDPAGVPVVDGSYSIRFRIYSAETADAGDPCAGTCLWEEVQSVSTQFGVYSVLLGSETPLTAGVFNDAKRYVGIKLGTELEMTPRRRIASVPFALASGTSGGALTVEILSDKSDTTWVCPDGVEYIHLTLVGAGGGGGSGNDPAWDKSGGGGGGGATLIDQLLKVTPGNSYSYTLGSGGLGGDVTGSPPTGVNGVAGGVTSFIGDTVPFDYMLFANGGSRGLAAATGTDGGGGQGGSGGSAGDLNASGTVPGTTFREYSDGGNGAGGSQNESGAGGSTYFFPAGGPGVTNQEGVDGQFGGGGSGGSHSNSLGALDGGNGGDGVIIIKYLAVGGP